MVYQYTYMELLYSLFVSLYMVQHRNKNRTSWHPIVCLCCTHIPSCFRVIPIYTHVCYNIETQLWLLNINILMNSVMFCMGCSIEIELFMHTLNKFIKSTSVIFCCFAFSFLADSVLKPSMISSSSSGAKSLPSCSIKVLLNE